MIAIIGVGGAGGNIADEAAKQGFYAGAINFSQKDLDSLEHVTLKLRVIGSDGVGHNRDEAIYLIQQHYEMVINFVRANFSHSSIDVIMLAFAASGGSGAGASPILLHILSNVFQDKVFVAVAIMPDESESTISQINTVKTFEELSKIDVCVFPIDNNQVVKQNLGKNKVFEITNSRFVSIISKLKAYTDKHSKNGNFDRKDFVTILNQKGIAIAAEIDIMSFNTGSNNNVSTEDIATTIHHSWECSVFAPIEYDYVAKAAVIFDANEALMAYLKYDLIFKHFRNGMPIDLFEGNYHEQSGKIITILSGLPWCRTRLGVIDTIIQENKKKVEATYATLENQVYESNSSDILSKIRKGNQRSQSVSDILNQYTRR